MTIKRSKSRTPQRKAATSADVLGDGARPPANPKVPAKWKSHHHRLQQLRDHLLHRQNDLMNDANEGQPGFSQHMADAGTDSFDRDFALSRASSEQDALYEIDEAIRRIQDGTYGFCELTGKPIEAARLEAVPWTRFSLEAEARLEKEGAISNARLGPRETVVRSETKDGEEADSDRE